LNLSVTAKTGLTGSIGPASRPLVSGPHAL